MARNLSGPFLAETLAAGLSPIFLFELETASGTSRAWTGFGTLNWNGVDWTGLGNLLGMSPVSESGDIEAHGVAISLSGIPSALVSLALADVRQGKPVRIWIAALDAAGAVLADPHKHFDGRFDTAIIDEGAETATITVQAENRLIDLERPRTRRYTPEDQAIEFPADRGLEYVASIQDKALVWGTS